MSADRGIGGGPGDLSFSRTAYRKQLWSNPERPVVIIHPGIVGDRGASALDWAITQQVRRWGVTALQAVEEMDAGPIWSTCEFDMPADVRKSELYNGLVSDAAISCIRDVVEKFARGFVPTPLDYTQPDVAGRLQPNMKQADRHLQLVRLRTVYQAQYRRR
jgi:putative two-component system protein, hydrogenase maturation factor HypX/HoxX